MPHPTSQAALPAVALALAALAGAPAAARAQNAASASVTADVQQPIAVAKTSDLTFGAVFPGVAKTVAVTDAAAAAFSIQGQANASVNLTFTLPSAIASGSASLPVTGWTARRSATNSPAAGTDFTPSASATTASLGGSGQLYVFLGATAQPAASQAAGSYAGTATVTVVYF